MIQRLFFYGIEVHGDDFVGIQGNQLAIQVFSNPANSGFPFINPAFMGAKTADYAVIAFRFA